MTLSYIIWNLNNLQGSREVNPKNKIVLKKFLWTELILILTFVSLGVIENLLILYRILSIFRLIYVPLLGIIVVLLLRYNQFRLNRNQQNQNQIQIESQNPPSNNEISIVKVRKGEFIGYCVVCLLPMYKMEELIKCPKCSTLAHKPDFLEWIKIKGVCPSCNSFLHYLGHEIVKVEV